MNRALLSTALKAILRPDIALIVLLILIVFMMVLPLPTLLVDILIGVNLSLAAILLVTSLYLPSPLAFSSFPSVLLIATLFRLALSISTTRLILLEGDAGTIVETFGNFVVGGNLIVGLIIFLILTLVQFIVITKGSERVAEVGARFSLDAMPGKQMSIDGDLRAGTIDKDEARTRRTTLEKENQFYGAMDGSMKFVKGDAIAGLIIVAVNLLGGIGIAVLQKDLTVADAVQTYSILTIGDGLVSQIPALLISIGAGIIVTRVTTSEGASNVGSEIGAQLMAQPKALIMGSAIALGFAAVPGMPVGVFLTMAALLGSGGSWLLRRNNGLLAGTMDAHGKAIGPKTHGASGTPGTPPTEAAAGSATGFSVPVMLSVASNLANRFGLTKINEAVQRISTAQAFELGLLVPEVLVRAGPELVDNQYQLFLNEVPIATGEVHEGQILALSPDYDLLNQLAIPYETINDSELAPTACWVTQKQNDTLRGLGLTTLAGLEILEEHLHILLERHAPELFGLQETYKLVAALETTSPDLVRDVQRVLTVQRISEVLHRLIAEGISIRHLKGILETLAEWGQKEKDVIVLTEYVRSEMRRQICYKYTRGQSILSAYLLSQAVEERLREAIRQTSSGSYIALEPGETKKFLAALQQHVGKLSGRRHRPVLLAPMDIRRYVRKLIENEHPLLAVVAYQELTPDVQLQALARIHVDL